MSKNIILSIDFYAENNKQSEIVNLVQGKLGTNQISNWNLDEIISKILKLGIDDILLVCLNGSFDNNHKIYKIVKEFVYKFPNKRFYVGGGIRNRYLLKKYKELGVQCVIGTSIFENPDIIKGYENNIIASVAFKNGSVKLKGWDKDTNITAEDYIQKCLELKITKFQLTDIENDGTLINNVKNINHLISKFKNNNIEFIVAGGVNGNTVDLFDCDNLIVGRWFYKETKSFEEYMISCIVNQIDYKDNNLAPTIILNKNNEVLMLGYTNKESLKLSLQNERVFLFSRSRNEIWDKGKTTNSPLKILEIKIDCDNDAIIYIVEDNNKFRCHSGTHSCFKHKNFIFKSDNKIYESTLKSLEDILLSKKSNNQSESWSYSKYILENPDLLNKKIIEEASEVILECDNLENEAADLLYHLILKLINSEKSIFNVLQILKSRM